MSKDNHQEKKPQESFEEFCQRLGIKPSHFDRASFLFALAIP
jgi:hypothetical protein